METTRASFDDDWIKMRYMYIRWNTTGKSVFERTLTSMHCLLGQQAGDRPLSTAVAPWSPCPPPPAVPTTHLLLVSCHLSLRHLSLCPQHAPLTDPRAHFLVCSSSSEINIWGRFFFCEPLSFENQNIGQLLKAPGTIPCVS